MRAFGRGFTLLELMVVVAIVALLVVVVGPSFRDLISVKRLSGVHAQLLTDLQFARTEAASRNAYLRVTFRSNASMTCYALYTYQVNASSCDCRNTPACTAADTTEVKVVRVPSDSGVQVRPPVGQVAEFAFDPITGALYKIPTDFFSPPLTQYVIRAFTDGTHELRTVVGLSGRPTVCAPTGSKMQAPAC